MASSSNPKLSYITIGTTTYELGALAEAIAATTAANIKLSEDLYLYTPIGKAQKAQNTVIGETGSSISNENPGKLGTAGVTTLKDVFNIIFGTI